MSAFENFIADLGRWPWISESLREAAWLSERMGAVEDALNIYDALTRIVPGQPVSHLDFARLCLGRGACDAAEFHAKIVARLDSTSVHELANAYYVLAAVARERGDAASRVKFLKRVIVLDEDGELGSGAKRALREAGN